MKKSELKKAINEVIEERLAKGKEKGDIYRHLQKEFDVDNLSKFMLATTPYPELCRKNFELNYVLVGILVVIAIVKVLFATLFILSASPKAIPIIILVPLINIYLIYIVFKFKGYAYMLTVMLGFVALCDMWVNLPDEPIPADIILTSVMSLLVLIAMIIAEVLRRRLLPNTTFFLRPKKSKAGEYIF